MELHPISNPTAISLQILPTSYALQVLPKPRLLHPIAPHQIVSVPPYFIDLPISINNILT